MFRGLAIIILAVLLAAPAAAQETAQGSFWDTLRSKLEKVTPSKKPVVTTAVGGVRGAKNEKVDDLYWKGKEQDIAVAAKELADFNMALESAVGGDSGQAVRQFEDFLTLYPLSPLRQDALQALAQLHQQP